MQTRPISQLLVVLTANWQAEMEGAAAYTRLAARELDPQRRNALRGLAAAEQHHADLWANRISELGGSAPVYRLQSCDVKGPLETFDDGNDSLRQLEIEESRDIASYAKQLAELDDRPSLAILQEVLADEREHYRTLGQLVRPEPNKPESTTARAQQALSDLLAARTKGRPEAAKWIGDAVYGVNDGLGSIFGIVSGVSGATTGNSHFVLIAGIAGMVASALSMGSGAYLAAKSQREIYEAAFARERESVELNEAEAREVLALTYQIKGLPEEDALRFVEHIGKERERLLRALARERLSTTEEGLSKPLVSAVSGALSTAVGAFIPIIPFFFMAGVPAIVAAAIVSLLAHFAVGAAKSLMTIRSWWSSALEMTLVGAVEGVVTYMIGIGLGRLGGVQ